jgi:hypothetical protein
LLAVVVFDVDFFVIILRIGLEIAWEGVDNPLMLSSLLGDGFGLVLGLRYYYMYGLLFLSAQR